ncbi:MAG: tRNA 2-selenouridine(34) synthase MnmH [Lentimicrobium sp.]|nr:tRNA 2-selenouridine(34) synthase MnmH [Lentimicrobium sp.]
MIKRVSPSWLYENGCKSPIIDVRSPLEYAQGHIPGSFNIPLLSDDERAIVGKLYKQSGKEASLLKGLDFVGVKMSGFVKKLKSLIKGKSKDVVVYCWRGGMRSASMAWLFDTSGFNTTVIDGGYKSYRAYIRQKSGMSIPIIVLGGMTGSGKTEILHELKKKGEQVIDLEGLAHNKGSVFGYLGQLPQPTNEQFENNLFDEWSKLNPGKPVWIEDESRSIGTVSLPNPFFESMKQAPMVMLDISIEKRVERLIAEYAGFDKELLLSAISRISVAMGGEGVKEAKNNIISGDFTRAIYLTLGYYDKKYRKALTKFEGRKIIPIKSETNNSVANAEMLLALKKDLLSLHAEDLCPK